VLGGRAIFSGGDWSFGLASPTEFMNTIHRCVDGCAPSDPEALGQTSAVADRFFHQEMGGLRTGEIRHPAANPTGTEIPAGTVE
jgi:hypothetical protein